MPKLSLIEAEAERLVGRLPEPRQRVLQMKLVKLCEERWGEIRGPEPRMPLAHVLWSATPPLADLFADLYAAGDPRLDEVFEGHKTELGLALLVLAEIELGDAEGVRLAHELMMIFESTELDAQYAERIAGILRGQMDTRSIPRQLMRQPLWKGLAVIVAHTKRWDLKAMVSVIRLLGAKPVVLDDTLQQLRKELEEIGMRFLNVDGNHILFEQHGHEHKPVSINQLGEALFLIRQAALG